MVDATPRGRLTANSDQTSPAAEPIRLSAVAKHIAAEPIKGPVSPIVLAGFVRLIDFAAISLLGSAIYLA